MSLKEKIARDTTAALKNRDRGKLTPLRFLQAAIKNKEIELRPESISEEQILGVIKKQIKQIRESIQHYERSDSGQERFKEEQNNLAVLESYLPKPLSEEELQIYLDEVIVSLKPQSLKDMGVVMKALLSKTGGRADGKTLSEMVRRRLQDL